MSPLLVAGIDGKQELLREESRGMKAQLVGFSWFVSYVQLHAAGSSRPNTQLVEAIGARRFWGLRRSCRAGCVDSTLRLAEGNLEKVKYNPQKGIYP